MKNSNQEDTRLSDNLNKLIIFNARMKAHGINVDDFYQVSVTEYEISAIGLEKANQMINNINPVKLEKIEEMVHEHGYQEIDSILHHVYVNYPTFTENSIIRDEVLNY